MSRWPWRPMETAPRDGTRFVRLGVVTVVGIKPAPPTNEQPYLDILYRHKSSADSPGYWMIDYGNGDGMSMADHDATCAGWWMPLEEFDPLCDSAPTWRTMPDDRSVATFRRVYGVMFDAGTSWRFPGGVTNLVMSGRAPVSPEYYDGQGGMAQHGIAMKWAELADFLPSARGGS